MLKKFLPRALSVGLSVALLVPLFPRTAEAQITLNIGQPNVWSLAQAHYLLSNMRHENRGLHAAQPTATELNPNSINGARLNILRTFLGINAEFNAPQGAQNAAALQGFQQAMGRRQEAQTRIGPLTQEHLAVVREISALNVRLAQLPPAPTGEGATEDPEITQTRRTLMASIAARTPVRDTLAAEIANMNTVLNAAPPTLASLNSTIGSAPTATFNDDLKNLIDKLADQSAPQLDASTALDNYIQMQYEIIAKQLTLLRDEVGPDERLIFLELPSSLYSVPKRDDNMLVQTTWNVRRYFGTCSDIETAEDDDERPDAAALRAPDPVTPPAEPRERVQTHPVTIDVINAYSDLRPALTPQYIDAARQYKVYKRSQELRSADERQEFLARMNTTQASNDEFASRFERMQRSERNVIERLANLNPDRLPSSLDRMDWRPVSDEAWTSAREQDPCGVRVPRSKFRVVDIIPRQSALNVNDTHATQSGFALTAKFLAIFGFGASVGYQRQRSVYEQFIHQDVFASGFGKGLDSFGWTIGPTPGTRRLAPGPRTTFAILAIPRGALAIELEADASTFRNNRAPTHDSARPLVSDQRFTLLVPQRDTEGFWVDSAVYTPVPSGERVTVLLRGKYFSPLTGVTVDGMPLRRAVALAKHESELTSNPTDTNGPGEFEYLNANELVLNFKIPRQNYVGTPLITLITPEKTAAINYYTDLLINHRFRTSLVRHSQVEPMFIGGLTLGGFRIISSTGGTVRAQLAGSGFRRRAQVFVNGVEVTSATVSSTRLIDLTFPTPADPTRWVITYRHGQEQEAINYVPAVDGLAAVAPSIDSIENPSNGKAEGLPAGGEVVIVRGRNLHNVTSAYFGTTEAKIDTSNSHPNVLFVTAPKHAEGGVRVLLVGYTPSGRVTNVLDFQTPNKAIYRYVPKANPQPATPTKPPKKSRYRRNPATAQ